MAATLPLLAVVMLLCAPLAAPAARRAGGGEEPEPWEGADHWAWLLPAVLALLTRGG